jgi:hypothetical protein
MWRAFFPILSIGPATCMAHGCDVAADAINEAVELLKEVGWQTDLDDGRHLADVCSVQSVTPPRRQVIRLRTVSAKAGCRRRAGAPARNADSRREFSDHIRRAIDDFNIGVAHTEICMMK